MNKKSILGLLIALALPLVCYLWLKVASDHAADVPRKYLLDTVLTRIEKGKEVTDSIWHKTANISLVNQLGDTVSIYDRSSKIMVVDYIFTSCRSICPKLTFNMQKLQHSFKLGGNVRNKIDTSVVQFVSFSVDPERDSVSVLKNYADLFGANHDNWWFLTGSKDSIYKFAFEELKVDKRVKYLIFQGKIWSAERASEGDREYTGSNKHNKHLHISIKEGCGDDTSPWFPWLGTPKAVAKVKAAVKRLPKKKEPTSPKE